MALPALGLVAKFVLANGTRQATLKYGPKAVKKAQEQIVKREKAIAKKQDPTTPYSKASQARSAETSKVKAREKRLEKERIDKDYFDIDGEPLDEVPLRFDLAYGGLLEDDRVKYKDGGAGIEALRKVAPEVVERMGYEEGGDVVNQMSTLMEPQNNEMLPETPMESDEEMEDNYMDFILDEALTEEEEDMLTSKLEQDEQLAMLFDKVIEVAQEFAGSGPVEGPGSGISDSIPARLSDGEFVFTAKAVEEIGADELMRMMKDAEANADKRLQAQYGGLVMEDQPEKVVQTETRIMKPADATSPALGVSEDDMIQEEVTRNMLDPRVQHVRS